MFFELRQYRTHSGKRSEWIRFMDEVIIPFQVLKGMIVVGSFAGEEEDDLYVWIRRFENEAERERLYEAVYQSPEWQEQIAPQIPDMLDRERTVVTRIEPTPRSIIR